MSALDALLGTISVNDAEVELGSGLNFTGGVQVERNPSTGKIDIEVTGGAISANNAQAGTGYTAVLEDAGRCTDFSNAGAIAWTIPPAASVAYLPGTVLTACQLGAGQVTATPGAGVTILTESGHTPKTAAQYTLIAVRLTNTVNTWVSLGRLA